MPAKPDKTRLDRTTLHEIEQHPVLGAATAHARAELNDTSQGIGQRWSARGKRKLIGTLLVEMSALLCAEDPVQAIRVRCIEFIMQTASFDVLIAVPPGIFAGVSGELGPHIAELATRDEALATFLRSLDPPPGDPLAIAEAIRMRHWVHRFYMNSYRVARVALGDCHPDSTRDWFAPCYVSSCIWWESRYRDLLGLPSAIPGRRPDLRAIVHSTWMNRALEGHSDLRLVWDLSWTEAWGEPSPYQGLALAGI